MDVRPVSEPERKKREVKPWSAWHNVTVSLEQSDMALLKVLCARYKVRSFSHALRFAVREAAGVDIKKGREA